MAQPIDESPVTVHCLFSAACGHVETGPPMLAHIAMENHYDAAHAGDMDNALGKRLPVWP